MTTPLPSSMVIGWNDTWFLKEGWYETAEGPQKILARWTAAEAFLTIPFGTWYEIEFILCGREMSGTSVGLTIYCDNTVLGFVSASRPDQFAFQSLPLQHPLVCTAERELRLVCTSSTQQVATFIPAANSDSTDFRELGVLVAAIRFLPDLK